MIMGWAGQQRPRNKQLSPITALERRPAREVAMHQIYLAIAVGSLTLLVGAYVLGVALG